MRFSKTGLSKEILQAVEKLGFEYPTPIQEQTIPEILTGTRDIVGLAQTGTGKTAAFGLPILDHIDAGSRETQALVLCPTRELCMQITKDLKSYAEYLPGVSIAAVYGGAGIESQIRALKRGAQIIAATPGRLMDLMRRRAADIGSIRYLVLDEADIMLDMGFKEELDSILASAPRERRTILLSATMPDGVGSISRQYMQDPVEITIGAKNTAVETVRHQYCMVHAREKYPALKRILDFHPDIYGIVFCRTKISTQDIADKLINDGYNAEALHGDLSQTQREYVMKKLRDRTVRILVATDIAARGLDVTDLTHIIHFDLPDKTEIYTHRSGRTGRAGKTGESIAIINMKEKYRIRKIENEIKREITEAPVPKGDAICEQQLMHLIDKVITTDVDSEQINKYLPMIEEKLAGLDRETLLKKIVSIEFNHFLQYYKNTPDLTAVKKTGREGERKGSKKKNGQHSRINQSQFTYLNINLGRDDRLQPQQLIGLVNQGTRDRSIRIGNIDIDHRTTRFEVESEKAETVYEALKSFTYRKKKVSVSRDRQKSTRNKQGMRKTA